MKNSIFKKLVSVVSVLAMVISCTATVFAANDYVSQSSPCEPDKTNWVFKRSPGTGQGVSATALDDGTFKMERTMFRTSTSECGIYGLTAEAGYYNGTEMWYKASADGTKWEAVANPPNWGSADNYYCNYSFANSKKFEEGTVQTKFDFAFEGDSNQCITIGFIGASATIESHYVGARIFRDNIRFWYPKGDGTSDPMYYNEEKTKLPCDKTWYTAVLTYNIDSRVVTLSIESRDDNSFSFARSFDISNTTQYWGSDTPGAISGVTFASYRGIDQSVISTTPNPATSIWYLDNVSLDAYTETNYELAYSYSSGDGVKSNAPATGFSADSISLSRLTNVLDPANASLITASYNDEGRMIAAQSKPLSQIGTDAEDVTVTGDTIKSFILDMKTAKPYINVFEGATPEKTVREIDFQDGFVMNSNAKLENIALHGYNTSKGHVMSVENGALKSERSIFRQTGTSNYWHYTDNKFEKTTDTPDNAGYYVRLGKTVSAVKGSLRFKFNGSDFGTAQEIQIQLGTDNGTPTENLIRIRRNSADGTGYIRTRQEGGTNWSGKMEDGEWYVFDFEITADAKIKYTITGKNINQTATKVLSNDGVFKAGSTFNVFAIRSMRDWDHAVAVGDYASATPTASTRNTSIWYIDDIVLKY